MGSQFNQDDASIQAASQAEGGVEGKEFKGNDMTSSAVRPAGVWMTCAVCRLLIPAVEAHQHGRNLPEGLLITT